MEEAYDYAQKCLEFPDVREEAKSLLKEISNRRGQLNKTNADLEGDNQGNNNSYIYKRLNLTLISF